MVRISVIDVSPCRTTYECQLCRKHSPFLQFATHVSTRARAERLRACTTHEWRPLWSRDQRLPLEEIVLAHWTGGKGRILIVRQVFVFLHQPVNEGRERYVGIMKLRSALTDAQPWKIELWCCRSRTWCWRVGAKISVVSSVVLCYRDTQVEEGR